MAKTYQPDDLAKRAFLIGMATVLLWIASVFVFIL
jgi:hypothetical protein